MKFSVTRNFSHAFQTLRKIVWSNTSLLQVHKTKLIKFYWSHVFDMLTTVRQFLVNQPLDKRILNSSNMKFVLQTQANAKTLQVERKWEERNEWNHIIFFCEILCLFVNLVSNASFCYKRKASKMGGEYKGDFKNANFPTL